MDLRETYNKIAEDWYNEVSASHWWEPGLKKFVSLLGKNNRVLDVGCGPGITAKYFIENRIQVFGIDFSEKMIEIAQRKVPEGKFLVMDLRDVNKISEKFDGIYLQNVLLHIPKKEAGNILAKVVEPLKEGGYVYVSVKEKAENGPDEYIKVDSDYGYPVERFFSLFSREEMEKYFKELGLKIVFFEIVPVGKTRWMQIIGKK